MILALGVFYSGVVSLNQYSSEYSKTKKAIRPRKEPSLILSFLKSAGLTAIAADSGRMVIYTTSSFCFSGLMNFKTAFVCVLGATFTSGSSNFFALINERYLIYLILGLGGIGRFILRKSSKENLKLVALFIFSVGILLFGTVLIKDNFAFLGENDYVKHIVITVHNPFLVILIGALISFIMQSSAGFSFMIVGFWSSNLISYEQSILMLYGSCIAACIRGRLYALPFKGSARRLLLISTDVVSVSSIIIIGLYFIEKNTSAPLLNSLLRSIYKNVVFEVSGAMLISNLFIALLSLLFLKHLVRLYTNLYPDDPDEILVKTHYIQNIETRPESEWPVLINKEVDRITATLYVLVDFESSNNLSDVKAICNSNDLILNRMLDLHKHIYEGKNNNSIEEYLLYERLFYLEKLNKELLRYWGIMKKYDISSVDICTHAASIHILAALKCLSDFIYKQIDIHEIEIVFETLNFESRKIKVFEITKDIKAEYDATFELANVYCDILAYLSEIINSYKYSFNASVY